MSLVDDWAAEVEAELDHAWQKCWYGKRHSSAHELALRLDRIKKMLSNKENGDSPADLNEVESRFMLQTAGLLLIAAYTDVNKLREVANALEQEKADDPRQRNILNAYSTAIERTYPPTLKELKTSFVELFGTSKWTSDFSVRKTLRILGLPLRGDKLGRPKRRKVGRSY